jgi:hypothetical protein
MSTIIKAKSTVSEFFLSTHGSEKGELPKPRALPIFARKATPNGSKITGVYTADFVDALIFDKEETEAFEALKRENLQTDLVEIRSKERECDQDLQKLLFDSDGKKCKCTEQLKLDSNRIVDLFGVVTSKTLVENKLLSESRCNYITKQEWSTNDEIKTKAKVAANLEPGEVVAPRVNKSMCQFENCGKMSQGKDISPLSIIPHINLSVFC